jgi:hypothetical protein
MGQVRRTKPIFDLSINAAMAKFLGSIVKLRSMIVLVGIQNFEPLT